jgi:radical SAM-linked protein
MQRIRIHYAKGEALQYIGNLDLHKIWERTFRRALIPLAYSQGFHPQPRMHQACPLPLGFTSQVELLDFWCDSDESLAEIQTKLENTVQPGIEIQSLTTVPLKSPPLQTIVESTVYRVALDETADCQSIEAKAAQLNAEEHCLRQRRGKAYDLRALLKELTFLHEPSPAILMRLSALPGATGRPEEVLEELGISPLSVDVERIELTLSPLAAVLESELEA